MLFRKSHFTLRVYPHVTKVAIATTNTSRRGWGNTGYGEIKGKMEENDTHIFSLLNANFRLRLPKICINVVGWLVNSWPNWRLQRTLTFWVNETFLNSFLHNDMSNDLTNTKQAHFFGKCSSLRSRYLSRWLYYQITYPVWLLFNPLVGSIVVCGSCDRCTWEDWPIESIGEQKKQENAK